MTIHREGIASIILAIVFGIIVNAATYYLTPNTEWVKILGYLLSGLILVIILQFIHCSNRYLNLSENNMVEQFINKFPLKYEII